MDGYRVDAGHAFSYPNKDGAFFGAGSPKSQAARRFFGGGLGPGGRFLDAPEMFLGDLMALSDNLTKWR